MELQRWRFPFADEEAAPTDDVGGPIRKRDLGNHATEIYPDGSSAGGNDVGDATDHIDGDPLLGFVGEVHRAPPKNHVLFACAGPFHFAADEAGAEPEAEAAEEEGKHRGE
ncbi:MAG: hypothetical protein CMH55_08000 [Myxococcales bacterium]|nr:hypothetical protein [Myxococcales bacterium]